MNPTKTESADSAQNHIDRSKLEEFKSDFRGSCLLYTSDAADERVRV